MSDGTRIPLAKAEALAMELVEILRPVTDRIEIAGSIRRRKAEVGDIEIVMAPRFEEVPGDLFGDTTDRINHQFKRVLELRREGVLTDRPNSLGHPACGERFQRMLYKGVPCDLFSVVPPRQWGFIFWLRTGPAHQNKTMMTRRSEGGTLPDHMRCRGGRLWVYGRSVPTPEEEDFYREIGLDFVEPERRGLAR